MFQLTKDIIDKTLEANLYVDQWPEYTTIISQEFTPRLSEVRIGYIINRCVQMKEMGPEIFYNNCQCTDILHSCVCMFILYVIMYLCIYVYVGQKHVFRMNKGWLKNKTYCVRESVKWSGCYDTCVIHIVWIL